MNLFAYGTLMWPQVLESVIGRRDEGDVAILNGYRRLCVKGQHYPAVVPHPGESVEGILYHDLSGSEFQRLDLFEGEEYSRVAVRIGEEEAQVYVLAEKWRHIADVKPWRPENMHPEKLKAFCSEYKGWRDI